MKFISKYIILAILIHFSFIGFCKIYKIGMPVVEGLMEITENGTPSGFPIEITEHMLRQENIQFEWVKGTWPELYSKALIGKIDALPGTQKTTERLKYLDFMQNSFYTIWGELYLREETVFISVSDLSNKKIGLVKDDNNATGFIKYITSFDIKYIPVYFNSHQEAINALTSKTIYGFVGPMASRIKHTDNQIKSSGLFFNPTDMTIAFPKNKNIDLRNRLDKKLYMLKGDENSIYTTLFNKYNLGSFAQTKYELPKWTYYFIGSLSASILISALSILLLKTKIRSKTKALQEREELLKTSLVAGNMGIWHYDFETKTFDISIDFIATNNLSSNIFHINDIKQRVSKWQLNKAQAIFKKAIKSKTSIEIEIDFVNDKKEYINSRLTGSVLLDAKGKALRANGIIQNTTKQKKYEKELILAKKEAEKSEKLMSAFLANISHEIRTPLNAILGFSNIIAVNNTTDQKKNDYKSIINTQGNLLLTLINDLLDMAKIESGSMTINVEHIEIKTLIGDIIKNFQNRNKNKTIITNNTKEKNNPIIKADKARMIQILNNLILNAEKHSKGKEIEIGIEETDKQIMIYVKDNGSGIPEEKQKTIFDKFKKLDVKVQGTGLGLAISKSLATLMNAELLLESEINKGAKFLLLFQKMNNELTHKKGISEEEKKIGNQKKSEILVVEDIQSNFLLIETFLLDITDKITWAKNGQEAVDFAKEKHFDLILMDLQMPIMDGFEATAIIKKQTPLVPIIALTAHAFIADIRKAEKSGCDAYITKPIDYDDLMNKIADFTTQKQL